jgi:hypothetical protein
MRPIYCAIAGALLVAANANAQWEKVPDRALRRAADGSYDLTGPAPMRGRQPDLSGVWLADVDPTMTELSIEHMPFAKHFVNITADMPPETVPMQPWAAELLQERLAAGGTIDPIAHCKPSGVPIVNTVPLPLKIVQSDELILILYEENTVFRQIFLDGRKPVEDAVPRWMGYSTGRWEGNTLVVDTVGFNDRHWLDAMGHPNTDRLRLTERFQRADAGHMTIEITVDDPGAYTRPITYKPTYTLIPDEDLLEYFCTENEKDIARYQ